MRCIDLFSGCGGLSRGFMNSGHEIVAAFDNWEAAIACYAKNFTHPIFTQDLSDYDESIKRIKKLKFDVVIGGPPCQDFSDAGSRTEGKRAKLTVTFAKIVAETKPKYFVMENVSRAYKSDAYAQAREIFKNAGYGLTERTLNSCYCGVPQNRKRFFSIGALSAEDGYLDDLLSSKMSEEPMTVAEYFGNELRIDYYYRHPRTYGRRGIFSVNEPAPTVRGSNRPLPPTYSMHPQDAISPKEGVRALTFRERARIQTFPDSFEWLDSLSANNQLIGNAVPVKLAEYVGNTLLAYSQGYYTSKDIGFVDWLVKEKEYTKRAAGNVLSRVRRLKKMYDSVFGLTEKNIMESIDLNKVNSIEEFSQLTYSVKSQLRRAYHLHVEYEQK